mgnify:CR=1 FL=1
MKSIPLSIAILIISLTSFNAKAIDENINSESLCFISTNQKTPFGLEFKIYTDVAQKWSYGYVKYNTSEQKIPVVLTSIKINSGEDDNSSNLVQTWVEVINKAITGEYTLKVNGIHSELFYKNYKKHDKQHSFLLDTSQSDYICRNP